MLGSSNSAGRHPRAGVAAPRRGTRLPLPVVSLLLSVANMRARGRQPLRGGAVLKKGTPYDDDFFSHLHAGSLQSARAILPRVLELTSAASVVDVGCGSGSWMRALGELGVTDVWGVDGSYAPADVGTYGTFVAHDLRRPLRLSRRFDLAICLEVAEHLPAERATGLVADLVEAAPAVLFSAAIPGQAAPVTSIFVGPTTGSRCSRAIDGPAGTQSGRGSAPMTLSTGGTGRTHSWPPTPRSRAP
jgi:SAM-dependent methyltransferase